MNILIPINDAPYSTEKAYNTFRLAMALQKKHPTVQVNVFLMADAVSCAVPNQNTPQGYYNTERMLKSIIGKGGKVKACGTCADARGIRNPHLVEGIDISNIAELAQWTIDADKVSTF
jgi:uncharacterized protein involved in oxidation of intracellular sulfur